MALKKNPMPRARGALLRKVRESALAGKSIDTIMSDLGAKGFKPRRQTVIGYLYKMRREGILPKDHPPIPAQLFHYEAGKAVPGRVFHPFYSQWHNPQVIPHYDPRVRHYQELEAFMLQNPGMAVPNKAIASERKTSRKTVDKVIDFLTKRHNLPPRIGGSRLPIKIQNIAFEMHKAAKPGQKLELLELIYKAYKASNGMVISQDAARKLLQEIELHSKEPKIIKFGMWKLYRKDNIGVLRRKMNELERMEKQGKLPWQK